MPIIHHSFQIAVTMSSKHLLVLTLLLGFLLINPIIKARAESIEFAGRAESIELAGYGEKKLSNVVVVGKVFCDTCLKHRFSEKSSHAITGALVALDCSINRKTTASSVNVGESDEYGDFSVEVPSIFHPEGRVNRCSVRLLHSSEGSCNTRSTTTPTYLALISNSNGVRTYTAGSLSYRPQHIPRFC